MQCNTILTTGSRQLGQSLAVSPCKGGIRVDRMSLQEFHKLIGDSGRSKKYKIEEPVVENGDMVPQETIRPKSVAAKRLHDQQMMKLVPFLGIMDLAEFYHTAKSALKENSVSCLLPQQQYYVIRLVLLTNGSPPTQRFIKVQHGNVGKVRNPSNGL